MGEESAFLAEHRSSRDDGRGFDLEKASEGQGLLSMTRRAGRLGGELRIDSKPGKGTEICLRVPRRGH